jgi:hypothetical protein
MVDYRNWPIPEFIVSVIVIAVFLFWQSLFETSIIKLPINIGISFAERQFNRVINAIDVNNETLIKRELEHYFGAYDSDTWKNGLGSVINETGSWPLYMFFSELPDNGRALVQGLWNKRVDELQLADAPNSLKPLLNCRLAIRNLLLFNSTPIHTPFFHNEDFNTANSPLSAISNKVYVWTEAHTDAVKKLHGCDIKPKPSEMLLSWIKNCVIPINGNFTNDAELQRIKAVGDVCGMVTFVSQ